MKKLLALTLALLMLFSIPACGNGNQPSSGNNASSLNNSGTPLTDGNQGSSSTSGDDTKSYAGAYTRSEKMITLLSDTLEEIIEDYNEKSEAEDEMHIMSGKYVNAPFLPFLSVDRAFTATLDESTTEQTMNMAFSLLGAENIVFRRNAANDYTLSFESEYEGEKTSTEMNAKYDPATDSMQYVEYETTSGREVNEFFEYVPLGNNVYAMQSRSERALATVVDGKITNLAFSTRKWYEGFGEDAVSDKRPYDLEAVSIYQKGAKLDQNWVTEDKESLASIYIYDGTTLTVETCKSDTTDSGAIEWQWKEPVVITQ